MTVDVDPLLAAEPDLHTGLTADPDADADRLLRLLVLPVESSPPRS